MQVSINAKFIYVACCKILFHEEKGRNMDMGRKKYDKKKLSWNITN